MKKDRQNKSILKYYKLMEKKKKTLIIIIYIILVLLIIFSIMYILKELYWKKEAINEAKIIDTIQIDEKKVTKKVLKKCYK